MARKKSSVTIRDVAQKAHVSTATVSRTFNKTGFVKKETQEAIMETAKELGYTYTAPKESVSTPFPAIQNKKSNDTYQYPFSNQSFLLRYCTGH